MLCVNLVEMPKIILWYLVSSYKIKFRNIDYISKYFLIKQSPNMVSDTIAKICARIYPKPVAMWKCSAHTKMFGK